MSTEDRSTGALKTIGYEHHEVHDGEHYHVTLSTSDIGALTTATDTLTVSWTTPPVKEMHLAWSAICADGARVRLIRGKTGGGATPSGTVTAYNSNELSSNTSHVTDVSGANAGSVSHGATLFTGGVTLHDEYLGGASIGANLGVGAARGDNEIILKKSTLYQLSIFLSAAKVATLKMSWYEHIPKDSN